MLAGVADYDLKGDDPEKQERTPAGDPVHRYGEGPIPGDPEISVGDEELIDAVNAHVERIFPGVETSVFHEVVSPTVHLDVYVIPPNGVVDAWTLLTSGMAERPMSPPPEAIKELGDVRYAELVTLLPPDWPLYDGDRVSGRDEHFWPIGWMKFLARFPHEYATWFWQGHTIPNGEEMEPFAGTPFVGSMLHPPTLLPESFATFEAGDRNVSVFAVWPLHKEEMDYKLKRGADAVIEKLAAAGASELVDPSRPSAVRRKRFGLF